MLGQHRCLQAKIQVYPCLCSVAGGLQRKPVEAGECRVLQNLWIEALHDLERLGVLFLKEERKRLGGGKNRIGGRLPVNFTRQFVRLEFLGIQQEGHQRHIVLERKIRRVECSLVAEKLQ